MLDAAEPTLGDPLGVAWTLRNLSAAAVSPIAIELALLDETDAEIDSVAATLTLAAGAQHDATAVFATAGLDLGAPYRIALRATLPGAATYAELASASFTVVRPAPPGLLLSEIDYDMNGVDDGELVEIYNPTLVSVTLEGGDLIVLVHCDGASGAVLWEEPLHGIALSGAYFTVLSASNVVDLDQADMIGVFAEIEDGGSVLGGAPDAMALVARRGGVDILLDSISWEHDAGENFTCVTSAGLEIAFTRGENATALADPSSDGESLQRVHDLNQANDATQWTIDERTVQTQQPVVLMGFTIE